MFSFQSVHGRDPHFHLCCQPGQFLAGADHSHHPLCHFHSLPHGHHPLHPRPVLSGRGVSQPRPAHPAEGPAEHPGHHERALQRPGRWGPRIQLRRRPKFIHLNTLEKVKRAFFLTCSGPDQRPDTWRHGSHPGQPWGAAEVDALPALWRVAAPEQRGAQQHTQLAPVSAGTQIHKDYYKRYHFFLWLHL